MPSFDVRSLVPERRLLFGVGLGLLVAFGLALAYVYGGGMELLGNDAFQSIDGYAFTIALLVGSLVPVSYYVYFRDVSEALAIFAALVWSLYGGLEDVYVYLLLPDRSIPGKLPWLSTEIDLYFFSFKLPFEVFTRELLLGSVVLGFVVLLVFVKILELVEENFLGVNL